MVCKFWYLTAVLHFPSPPNARNGINERSAYSKNSNDELSDSATTALYKEVSLQFSWKIGQGFSNIRGFGILMNYVIDFPEENHSIKYWKY